MGRDVADSNKEITIEMMWGWTGYGYNWMGWTVGAVLTLLVLGGLVALAVWAVTSVASPRSEANRSETNGAEEILRQRLAKGEITEEQYVRLRRVLNGQP